MANKVLDVGISRRDQLLTVATTLFLEKGYSATGVDDIGEAAGITGPALYRHFDSKQAILDAICVERMEKLLDRIADAASGDRRPRQVLSALVDTRVEFAFSPDRLVLPLHHSEERNLSDRARRRMAALEDVYFATWLRVLTLVRPNVAASELHSAVRGAHMLIGYTALREHASDVDALKEHIARMAVAALLA